MASLKTETSYASSTSIGSPHTPKATSPEQRDIEAIWRQVHEKVVQLAGTDPQFEIQKTLDIDGVLRRLDALQQANKKEPSKFDDFKNVVRKTLQCIQTIGGIVADGASEVFAPSAMCYNALTFVIQAWQNYEGMFENLAELLEKCADFLTRLKYYENNMDLNLNRLACQNLRIFVEICDRTIRLRKKSNRFIRFTKQLFLNDDGIQDLLHMMEKLNNKEVPLVNAQIFKTVMDNAGKLDTALEEQKQQRKDEDWRKRRKTIAAALGFPKISLDSDGEPIQHWQRGFEARKATLVEGTGEWIEKDRIFLEWVRSTLPANPALVMQGRNRSGKTSMMANVLRTLRRMDRASPTSRRVLAYFFPDTDRKKSDDEDPSTYIERVSRILLWQVATAYESMTKSVANIIEREHDFDGCLDLWERLFINNKERQKDTTFYFFIDGIDSEVQTMMPLLERLCLVTDEHRPRIFLTARPETVTGWLMHAEKIHFESISLSDHNSEDVQKYIEHEMDNMLITKNPEGNSDIAKWRQRIQYDLARKCGSDYFKLNNTFDRLAKVDLVEDIERILEDAGKTRTDQIDSELRRLNKERTPKEIKEINEIILWIEGGRNWFSVEMMEALLSVKYRRTHVSPAAPASPLPVIRSSKSPSPHRGHSQERRTPPPPPPPPTSLAISLLPFAQKLQDKYGLFSITNSNTVDWRSSEYKERVPSRSFEPSQQLANDTPTSPQVIQESEIDIVRHFLRNVCPPHLYDRFEFDQFFNGKSGARHKDYICLDDDNENIKIAISCLTILTEEGIRFDTRLRYYAVYWVLDHLREVQLSLADRELKAEVGPLLVQLFTEEVGMDSLFWPFDTNVSMKTWNGGEQKYLREARAEWLYSNEGTREILRWFEDPVVARSITSEVGKEFMEAVKAPDANLHQVILSRAAKNMADHLFRRVEFTKREFLAACCFLRGYLSRLDPERSLEMPDEADPYRTEGTAAFGQFEDVQFTLEEIQQIEGWASEVLGRSKDTKALESLWEIHGSLIIFQLCDSTAEVYRARATKALELDHHNWHACHFIASQPITSNEDALKMLSHAKDELDKLRKRDPAWLEDSANSALLARITLKLGECIWESGKDYERAAKTHLESLDYNYVHFKDYGRIMQGYSKRQSWDMLINFLGAINDHKGIWAAYFDELVNEFLFEYVIDKDSDMLAKAADATGRWDVVEKFFEISADIGRKSDGYDLLFLLRDAFSRTLEAAESGIQQSKVIAVREAAVQAIRSHPSATLERKFIDGMVDSLALAYLDFARHPSLAVEQVDQYGALLESLIPDTDDTYNIYLNSIPTCAVIRFHHRRQNASKRAAEFCQRIIQTSTELLSDEDEGNDVFAYWLLARLATVVGDVETMRVAWTMWNKIQHEAESQWKSWQASKDNASASGEGGDASKVTGSTEPKPGTTQESPKPKQAAPSPAPTSTPAPAVRKNDSDAKPHKLLAVKIPTELAEAASSHSHTTTSTGISDANATHGPHRPSIYAECDGCGRRWTVMEEPLYACADCVGDVHLDEGCHARLLKGEPMPGKKRNLRCRKEHEMFLIPKWDTALVRDMPKDCVPLLDGADKGKRWVTLAEWRRQLNGKYLGGDKNQASTNGQGVNGSPDKK